MATSIAGSDRAAAIDFAWSTKSDEIDASSLSREGPKADSYTLSVAHGRISLRATSAGGFHAAVSTLLQLVDGDQLFDSCRIVDWSPFSMRIVLLDIERGGIPTIASLIQRIDLLALLKINTVVLYSEASVRLSPVRSVSATHQLDAADIAALARASAASGIQLVAGQESFAHAAKLLRASGRSDLAMKGGDVDLANPGSAEFSAGIQKSVAQIFGSSVQFIGGDEVDVGAIPNGEEKYQNMVNAVANVLESIGVRTVLWSDVVLNHPNMQARIDKHTIMASWDYRVRRSYVDDFTPLRARGFDVIGIAGTQSWNRPISDITAASSNILGMARDAERAGAIGFGVADWNDDGRRLPESGIVPIALGAVAAWQGAKTSLSDFRNAVGWTLLGADSTDAIAAVESLADSEYTLRSVGLSWTSTRSQSSTEPYNDEQQRAWRAIAMSALLARQEFVRQMAVASKGSGILNELLFEAAHIAFLAELNVCDADVDQAAAANDRSRLAGLNARVRHLERELDNLQLIYERLWLDNFRRSSLSQARTQFDPLRIRLFLLEDRIRF